MISTALCNQPADMEILEKEIRNKAVLCTDERVVVKKLLNQKLFEEFLQERSLVDFICIDVTITHGIQNAELFRKNYPSTAIVLVADMSISPVSYMRPSIMAAALILKPLKRNLICQTLDQIFEHFVNRVSEDEILVVEAKGERQRIPYSAILYFEARAKKIYVCTKDTEYGFYDTMEHLEVDLPENFVRCHRGYIINKQYIRNVMISRGCVILQNDIEIPLSRSYKGVLKENVERK